MLKIILIASGKGGTGKTSFTAGVGAALAELGKKVLLLDGDCGLRNLDLVLGMQDRVVYSFEDVANGMLSLEEAMVRHPLYPNLWLLTAPGAKTTASPAGMHSLAEQAEKLGFAYLLLDGPAGIGSGIALLASIATQAILVSSTDAVCIRGAEQAARTLETQYDVMRQRLVISRVRPRLIRRGKSGTIDDVMDGIGLPLLGLVPECEQVIACSNSGSSILTAKRNNAARAYRNIARRLEGERVPLMNL